MVFGVGSSAVGSGAARLASERRAASSASAVGLADDGAFGRARGARAGAASAVELRVGGALPFSGGKEAVEADTIGATGGGGTVGETSALGSGGLGGDARGRESADVELGARWYLVHMTPRIAGGTPMSAPSPSVAAARRKKGWHQKASHGPLLKAIS